MVYFSDHEIDRLISEDVQFFDVTTSLLRLENKPAKIQVTTREPAVICCTEEVLKIFQKTGVQTTLFTPSGEYIEKDVKFLEGEGLSGTLFSISRTIENLLRYASGIATRTRLMVDLVQSVNPAVSVFTTRKIIPNTRKIAVKAVKSGGATVHRFGLSESILVYKNHLQFLGSEENLLKRIREQQAKTGGKLITVEVGTLEEALKMAETGVFQVLQLDRFSPADIKMLRKEINSRHPTIKLAAAGELDLNNGAEYALSGADVLVTSWPYYGEPAQMSISIQPIFDQY